MTTAISRGAREAAAARRPRGAHQRRLEVLVEAVAGVVLPYGARAPTHGTHPRASAAAVHRQQHQQHQQQHQQQRKRRRPRDQLAASSAARAEARTHPRGASDAQCCARAHSRSTTAAW
eukprot:scaffold6691_cov358-Prasinococcus_capsulatus_cf.AAC.29